jgi:hypothetical protein
LGIHSDNVDENHGRRGKHGAIQGFENHKTRGRLNA